MRSSLFLGAIMAIGAAAVPLDARALKVVDVVEVITKTVTAGHLPTPSTTTSPAAAANTGGFLEHPNPAPAPAPNPAPAPAPAPAPVSSGPVSGDSYLPIVNKWRQKYNLNQLTYNEALLSNAQQVGADGGGVNEVHQLIPGVAMGQVITPAQTNSVPSNQQGYSPFEIAYMAWLCEVPSDPQLQASANDGVDVCSLVQSVLHMEYSDTGHHDILVSSSYKSIACAFSANPNADQATATYQGLEVCNLS